MNYYILLYRPTDDDMTIIDYKCNLDEVVDKLSNCNKVKNKIQYLELIPDSENSNYSDIIDTMILTVSEDMRNSILKIIQDVEDIKVNIIGRKDIIKNYYAINILTLLDSLDRNESIYTTDKSGKTIRKIEKVVLDKSIIGSNHIFRDKSFSSRIVVSEKAKSILEKFTGVSFINISQFQKKF